jgi:hypothetical protein
MAIRISTNATLMYNRYGLISGTAEMMLSTPAATDTATVMM